MAVNTTVQVTLPAMGESVREGTVLEWHKQEGDAVEADEPLVDVSTDKVDAEVPAPAAGTLVKIHRRRRRDRRGRRASSPRSRRRRRPALRAAAEASSAPREAELVDIVTPAGGESVQEGTILEWAVQSATRPGGRPSSSSRPTRSTWSCRPGLRHDRRDPRRRRRHRRRRPRDRAHAPAHGAAAAPAPRGARPRPRPRRAEPAERRDGNGAHVSPVARRVAAAEGVDIAAVQGSGPAGRITKADVLAAKAAPAAPPAAPQTAAAPPPRRPAGSHRAQGRRRHARPLHGGLARDPDRDLAAHDHRHGDGRAPRRSSRTAGHKISFTHLIAYAIARAATEQMPVMAHHFAEIDGKPHRIDDGAVNLGIAVDVEKQDGSRTLMVPVIRDAGRLTFPEFLDAFGNLIARARENTLTADDLTRREPLADEPRRRSARSPRFRG